MSSICPFAGATTGGGVCPVKSDKSNTGVCPAKSDKSISGVCPVTGKDHGSKLKESGDHGEEKGTDPRVVPAKCPFGYDSNTFKLGPLSCIVCQALLHESSKCKPCAHKFCKCVSCLTSSSIAFCVSFVASIGSYWISLAGHVYHALKTAHYVVLI
jgi:hypothetical protein